MTLKRLFDVGVSSALLLLLLPLLGLIAAGILLLSGRPVLYRAVRVGRGGVPFVMYKFRTMSVSATGSAITGPQDPRLTRVGRWIRSGRLDELPQLVNVLRGDMSLVGPRPEDPRFVAGYTDAQRTVLTVRPGITSPAAIAYRDEAAWLPKDGTDRDAFYAELLLPAKLAIDVDYVRNRSFLGDIAILWTTVSAVASGTGTGTAEVSPSGSDDPTASAPTRQVLVLGATDGFANGVRMREVTRHLRSRGHEVTVVDTERISRMSSDPASWRSKLPRLGPRTSLLYAVELVGRIIRTSARARARLSYPQIVAELRMRSSVLTSQVDVRKPDLVICETPYDATFVAGLASVPRMYDCPTPWADELYYEGRLTQRQHRRMRERELEVFESVDVLSFHWHSYGHYAQREYGLSGRNLRVLDWGCSARPLRAAPAAPARVVYLGSLSSRFIDLPLLSRLCRLYPHIDVYGGPEPDPRLELPYRGYADPAVLDDYQFGLITCTNDPLRRAGFSAKHLEYLAAGLPVLVPAWRPADLEGSLAYDEEDFVRVVVSSSDPVVWSELSRAAHAQAGRLTWDRTLAGLDDLLV